MLYYGILFFSINGYFSHLLILQVLRNQCQALNTFVKLTKTATVDLLSVKPYRLSHKNLFLSKKTDILNMFVLSTTLFTFF